MTKIYLRIFVFGIAVAISFVLTSSLLKLRSIPTCANSKSCSTDLSMKIDNNTPGVFMGKKVNPPPVDLALSDSTVVLGDQAASGEKHIFVDLSTQTLIAYQGTTKILQTFVSTGKWAPTPTGNFHIWEKLRSTRMSGGEGDEAYDLPNVQYVMYFYHDFGLHQAYWHDNFGHAMSHGCVNLRLVDAKTLYEWADGPSNGQKGTEVSVCDKIDGTQCIQNNPVQL